ncbi:MAG TPA: YhbY family RNA-binding protein [Candidatus Thermoplasmatota archaeon]
MNESNLPITVQIGQEGLKESIVKEIQAQIDKKKVIRAKRVRSSLDERTEKEFWTELARQAGVRLVEVRGHTAVLADPRYVTDREREKRAKARKPPVKPQRDYL